LVLILATLAVGGVPAVSAPERSPSAAVQAARKALQARRFDSALQQLQRIKKPGERAGEVARLEATARLGKALQTDVAATEAMSALHLAGTAAHGLRSMGAQPENAEFIKEIEGQVTAYLQQAGKLAAGWPAQFRVVLVNLEQARSRAKQAYELETSGGASRDEAAALWAWAELYDFLAAREAQQAMLRAETAGVFAPDLIEAFRQVLPPERQPAAAKLRLKTTLVRLLPEVAQGKSTRLSLALADCLVIYAAVQERLRSGRFGSAQARYANPFLGRNRRSGTPSSNTPPPAVDPAVLLEAKTIEERLNSQPESLILPLYQLASREEESQTALAAEYGLYFALLAHNEGEAGQVLERLLKRQPDSAAFLLEKVRYATVQQDAEAAHKALLTALSPRSLRRPVFVSLPESVRSLWLASRPATVLIPQFWFPYRALASVGVPAGVKQGPEAAALPLQQLRLAELSMKGNVLADVMEGVWGAEAALERLRESELPMADRARLEDYQQNLTAATARVPAALIRPHLTFSTYEVLPDGSKQVRRTLTISRTGLVAFGKFAPNL
jgi:hypothetical protein